MDRIVVDQINTVYASGSGTASRRLHEGLIAAGVDSRLWVKRPKRGGLPADPQLNGIDWPLRTSPSPLQRWIENTIFFGRKQWNKWRMAAALYGRQPGFEVFTTASRDRQTPFDRQVFQGNVLHLHWVTGLLDWPSFFASVPDNLPIVWTLHDMNPLTGGCHHADDCREFMSACRACPQLGPHSGADLAATTFVVKQAAYSGKQLHLVTPSRWLERHVRNSALMRGACSIQTIRNGLDISVYRPQEKLTARRHLGIPADRLIVGFGADSLKNPRKGIAELFEAFAKLTQFDRICGITLGRKELPDSGLPRPRIFPMGYVQDAHRQTQIYSAMDVFALPSWGENMPQMAIEAMACGTPVIAFDVGGTPEIVRPDDTGLLAPLRDCHRLATHLSWCLENPDQLRQMGIRGRKLIEDEFDLRQTTATYQKLYESALERSCKAHESAPQAA